MIQRCRHIRNFTVLEDYQGCAQYVFEDGEPVEVTDADITNQRRFIDVICDDCGLRWRGDPNRRSAPAYVRYAAARVDKARSGV